MQTIPEKVRETLGNTNQNETTRAEHKNVSEKKKKEAFRIKGALSNAKQNKNTHNNTIQKKAKEKALK